MSYHTLKKEKNTFIINKKVRADPFLIPKEEGSVGFNLLKEGGLPICALIYDWISYFSSLKSKVNGGIYFIKIQLLSL